MELLNASNEIIASTQSAITFFDMLYSKVASIKAKKLSQQNYLRAYYFEVVNNLELLNVTNIKKVSSLDLSSETFQKFINRIETQIGASLLFSEDIESTSNIYKLLKTKGTINNTHKMISIYQNGKETISSKKMIYENVLQAISFTVVKTEVLRQLSTYSPDEREYVQHIMIERRIVNLKERFTMIKKVMDQIEGINELAR